MVWIDREDAVALEVRTVSLDMPIALDDPDAAGHRAVRNLSVHGALGSPGTGGEYGASPPMAKQPGKGGVGTRRGPVVVIVEPVAGSTRGSLHDIPLTPAARERHRMGLS